MLTSNPEEKKKKNFCENFKNPYFWLPWVHFPHFWKNKNFLKKSGSVNFQIFKYVPSCKKNQKKTNLQLPRKIPN